MATSFPHPDEPMSADALAVAQMTRKRPTIKIDDDDSPKVPSLEKLKRYFTEARDLTQEPRTKSLRALDYYHSDQFTPQELQALAARKQPPIIINRIKPAINGIAGVTERGHSEPRALPRHPGAEDTADAATDILRFIADFNRFKPLKQECFFDMLIPGTMAALVGVDEDRQVTITQIRWEEHFADPRSRRRDFKDARFQGIAKWMYADDVAAMYPDKEDAIEATVLNGVGGGLAPDQSYQDRPQAGTGTATAWIDKRQRRLLVVEIYYRDAGWKRAVFTSSDILEHGDSPYLDHKRRPDCPIEAMSAYVRRDNGRYGVVQDMIDVQDEINQRRSKSLHNLATTRIEVTKPDAIDVDANEARKEAARPDGVIPFGWGLVPNTLAFQGNLELLAEAKGEIERMGPSPAMLGRSDDASGRHLLARQQAGMVELASIYGALEDWELRIYRQCWGRAKQFWTAPQFIRVTDDENAPKFVGLNQPIQPGDPDDPTQQPAQPGQQPSTPADPAQAMMQPGALGYRNVVGEMDVDIDIESQPEQGPIIQESFNEILKLVGMSPYYQQQITLKQLVQLSPIPHKRSLIDALDEQAQQQAQQKAQAEQLALQHSQAQLENVGADTEQKKATGVAKITDALTYAHSVRADHVAAGVEAGVQHAQTQQAQAFTTSQNAQQADQENAARASDQAHQAGMAAQAQAAQPDTDQDGQ